jgi:hypothetical protein
MEVEGAEGLRDELPVVAALRTLSIFGADQGGAYREHYGRIAETLGTDVPTLLGENTRAWVRSGVAGLRVLTGNAGTGKTAVAEAFCRASGAQLPAADELIEVAAGRFVIKDLSGLPGPQERLDAMRRAIAAARGGGQALVCANEGVMRDAAEALGDDGPLVLSLLEQALRQGADESDAILIVNVNRQRPTAPDLWGALVDYVAREELWEPGCEGCPHDAAGCPMRSNAAALRKPEVRVAMRTLVQLATGEAVPTLRELLAILAHALVGGASCQEIKQRARDRGRQGFTAEEAYFARALGQGLRAETAERSPLLLGLRRSGLGKLADLQADEWLRDTSGAPESVRALAGAPELGEQNPPPLGGSRSPLDRINAVGTMTFHELGETIATSEDVARVDQCLEALVGRPPYETSRQALWRQRLFFEGAEALGGSAACCARLLDARNFSDFLTLADEVAGGGQGVIELATIVQGLNFLVCGFSSATEGLVVPDQACLFARDPGSFRPARPSLVHGQIALDDLALRTPDRGLIEDLVDIDHIELELVANRRDDLALRIRPRLYEAIREAAAFEGPVGQGIAEMTDVRGFYGRLARVIEQQAVLRVADPSATPPALITISLPHFGR